MKIDMYGEVTDGRYFIEYHEGRLNDLRREVESLECTVTLMRRLLEAIKGRSNPRARHSFSG